MTSNLVTAFPFAHDLVDATLCSADISWLLLFSLGHVLFEWTAFVQFLYIVSKRRGFMLEIVLDCF